MATTVHVPCSHCAEELAFEVEAWAEPPTEVYCDTTCHQAARAQVATPEAVTASS